MPRILVDIFPSKPEECPYYYDLHTNDGWCRLGNEQINCKIGQEGFICPYLREFCAVSEEPLNGYGRVVKRIPVKLEGQ